MPLSAYLGIGLAALATLAMAQCSGMNNLREQIGVERQKCATEFAEYSAKRQAELREVETRAARERAITAETMRQAFAELQEENYALMNRVAHTERRLTSAMRRVQTEDKSWCDTLVPAYLLQPD